MSLFAAEAAYAKPKKNPPPPPPIEEPANDVNDDSATESEFNFLDYENVTLDPLWGDISPFYGDISPFWGDISPFWGDISPFWGDISPFYGDISAFWGDIEAFWGDISAFNGEIDPRWGDISAFWGDISAFWGDISPFWGDIEAFWGDIAAFGGDHQMTADAMQSMFDHAEEFWAPLVEARANGNFQDEFVDKLLAKHGIDLNDPSSFEGFTAAERAAFMFDFYDTLMGFTGFDHTDHWMATVNWNPNITQAQGSGFDTVIGLIDFAVTPDADLTDNVIAWDGSQDAAGGHGGAVASLMVADHDGRGVMGIAPRASVAMYNPFDEDGTANWDSVKNGIVSVVDAGASVVNMSLGVSGHTFHAGWHEVYFDDAVQAVSDDVIFVHAAGNEGVEQTDDVVWDVQNSPNFLIVGSVGPSGQISPFSNTPGDACLTNSAGACLDELKNHFLVAPGEWILVTDGQGGVTRASGTSFAAPMVTGAIALMHDRWKWLSEHPEETVDILLSTAQDLGEEGVDGVYGHGLLDIQASQSPVNWDDVYFYVEENGELKKQNVKQLKAKKNSKTKLKNTIWHNDVDYFVGFEDVGKTHRDFLIPMADKLVGTYASVDGRQEMFQDYLFKGFEAWGAGQTGFNQQTIGNPMRWDMRVSFSPLDPGAQHRDGSLPYKAELAIHGKGDMVMRVGSGYGAQSLTGQSNAGAFSFNQHVGGANPVLGLASGGVYGKLEMPVTDSGLRLNFGMTRRDFEQVEIDGISGEEQAIYENLAPYSASAAHVSVTQPVGEKLEITAGYTFLNEQDGLLGVQTLDPSGFAGDAQTDAASIGMEYALSARVSLSGLATYGKTRSQSANGTAFAVSEGGVETSAFEASLNLRDTFSAGDKMRIALLQPMHVESGSLDFKSYEVIDRATGEIGAVERSTAIDARGREFALEALYAKPAFDGMGEVAGFIRVENEAETGDTTPMLGGKVNVKF